MGIAVNSASVTPFPAFAGPPPQPASLPPSNVQAGGGAPAASPSQQASASGAQPAAVNQVQAPSRPTSMALPGAVSGAPQSLSPLPAPKPPDEGKTWGGPNSTQPLNFGHPLKNGKLIEMDPSGVPVWASSGKALTSDQYAAMPEFQKRQIREDVVRYASRPGVPADKRLIEAFDTAMQGGSAARSTTVAPGASATPAAAPVQPSSAAAPQPGPAPAAQAAPSPAAAPVAGGAVTPEAADAKVVDVMSRLSGLDTSAPRAAREAAFRDIEKLLSESKQQLSQLPAEAYATPKARLLQAESLYNRMKDHLATLP